MITNKCPQCGEMLTQEMIDSNMCWECGKILDESFVDEEVLSEVAEQEKSSNPFERKEIKEHKITTGFEFVGWHISEYLGIVSGETVIGTGFISDFKASMSDLFGVESKTYTNKIKKAKQNALYDMIEESISKGGNAIIGVSYGYVVFSGNMIGISVNGTSVRTEKV